MTAHSHDVVVVGAGAGGGAAAWALSKFGVKVLLLESGPEYDPFKDFKLHQDDWEKQVFPAKRRGLSRGYRMARLQALDEQWQNLRSWNAVSGLQVASSRRHPGRYHHVRGLGGSTLHFTGEAHRMHPRAMTMHRDFGVAADWPVLYDELESYYQQAEQLVGVAGPASAAERPRSQPYPLKEHPPCYASQHIMAATNELELSWSANPLAVLSRPYDDRPGCNYCNNCGRGCPRTDKGSVDVTFLRHARASGNCTVVTGANVTFIEAGPDDVVRSIRYIDSDDMEHKINTRCLVVAGGAVMTPRLLLASKNSTASDGLANESGQVGRHFMETHYWSSSGLHPQALGSHRGLPADIISWSYNAPDAIPGVVGGCRITAGAGQAFLTGPIHYAQRLIKGWGHQHKQQMRDAFGRAMNIAAIGESLPSPKSFIDLDPEQEDEHGVPFARIHSFLEDSEIKRIEFMANKCREILAACGVDRILEENGTYDFFSATHVFGTCRMGNDPETSVVNSDGRAHRWKNLYVADASVFPSSGGGESPSLTIYALAIRTAEKIRQAMVERVI